MTKKKKLNREEIYKKNTDAFKTTGAAIVERLDDPNIKKPAWLEPIKSNNGDPNIQIKGLNNDVRPAYEMEAPRKKPREIIRGFSFFKETATVIVGIGAGHLLKQILTKKEKAHGVVVVESSLYLINYALHNYNFSKWILDGSLFFATTKEEVGECITFIDHIAVIQDWAVIMEGYVMARPREYEQIIHYTHELINQIKCNTGTVMGAGSTIADNDIINMPYIIKHRGVEELRDLYKGKPAITINTGPSLKKNLYLLLDEEKRKNIIVIAVAQALRLLLAYGIKPDFITTVDYGAVNQTHFDGIMDCDVPIVCLNRTYAPIIKRYKGNKFIVVSSQPGYPMSSVKLMEEKGQIIQGGSVSHLSLGLALHLGCNPITITGQDLSYGETLERSHTDGADSSGKLKIENGLLVWEVDDPNSDLINKEKQIMGIPQHVEGYFGRLVITNVGLLSFITSFENIVKGHPENDLYNSTEGGARIKGMKQISLRKFLEDFCTTEINKSKIKKLDGYCTNWKGLINKVIPMLSKEMEELKEMSFHCEEGIRYGELMKEKCTMEEILDYMEKNRGHSIKAHELAKKNQLVVISILKENREIHTRKLKVSSKDLHLEESKKRRDILIQRNKLILNSVLKSCERLIPLYEKTRNILETYIKTKDDSLLTEDKDITMNLEDCEEYFKTGNWAWPMVAAYKELGIYPIDPDKDFLQIKGKQNELTNIHKIIHRATEMKLAEIEKAENEPNRQKEIEYNEYIYNAIIEGRDNKDYKRALELLEKSIEMYPDKELARWGYATSLMETGNIDKSLETYKQLVEDFPKNHRYKFEYGYTMLRKDVEEGIKLIIEAQKETTDYDYMFDVFGDIYIEMANKETVVDNKLKLTKKASVAYEEYLKKYPININTMEKLSKCYSILDMENKAKELNLKIKKIKMSS